MIPTTLIGLLQLFLAALVAGMGWTFGTFLMSLVVGVFKGSLNHE
jgi:branched-subunit amino acid ABC-type transport system permease component